MKTDGVYRASAGRRAAAGLVLLLGAGALAAPPDVAPPGSPRARFRRDPDSVPAPRLVPVRPAKLERPGPETFDAFDRWAEAHGRGAAPLADGVAHARARRQALARLIELDPAAALARAVPDEVRARLPAAVAAELEERVRGVGALVVICAYPTNRAEQVSIQREVVVNGRHLRAFTSGRRLEQVCTRETPVFGVAVGDAMALDEQPFRLLDGDAADAARRAERGAVRDAWTDDPIPPGAAVFALDEGDRIAYFGTDASRDAYLLENWTPYIAEFGGGAGGSGVNTWTQGLRKFVFWRCRLAEDAANYEPTSYSAGVTAYTTMSNWYYEWSYGTCTAQYLVVTNVFVFTNSGAWYEANGGWPKLLSDARTMSLSTPDPYTNFNFDAICHNWNVGLSGYAGVAYVGGRGVSFHEGYGSNDGVVGHEHGHNLGLPHANYWNTSGQSIFGPGAHEEYGNDYDIMGNGYADWPFASNMRNRMRWLPDTNAFYNVADGTYRLFAFDQVSLATPDTNFSPGMFALALPRDGRNYVFDFREDLARIGTNTNFLNGVHLIVDNGFGGGPELLDCTPGSPGGKSDCALTIGRMFTDPNVNVHVTPIARGPSSRTNWIDLVVNRNSQVSNHAPAVAVSASAYTTGVGVAVTLTATASDPDGDTLAYYWDFGNNTFSYNNAAVQTPVWPAAGVYAVRCVAADMRGREAVDYAVITVGSPGAKYTIRGRVRTPGGEPVAGVRLAASGGTSYFSDSAGDYAIPNLSTGSYTIVAYGCDAYGNPYTFAYQFPNPLALGADAWDRDIVAALSTDANAGPGTGFLYERWDNITGNYVTDLTSNPRYPNQPDDQRLLRTSFETANGRGDNYGTRLRAFYIAPTGGAYRFWIASDDYSELWLSLTTNPAAATKVAYVNGYTDYRQWTKFTSQQSAAITLTNGQRCYIQALQKEGGGGDHLSIGADLPGGTQERPIPFHRLDPWPLVTSAPPALVSVAASDPLAAEAGLDPGTFTFTRAGDTVTPLTVTFQVSGTAAYDVDYQPIGVTVAFAANADTATVTVTPRADTTPELVETVTVTPLPGAAYGVSGGGATVSIGDDEPTTVSIYATDPQASEAGNTGQFAVVRSGLATGTITVGLTVGGTASNGVDFVALPSSIVIPAGTSLVTLAVAPVADGVVEVGESVSVSVKPGAGYALAAPTSAVVIVDADPGPGTGILREWWTDISGSTVPDLTNNAAYPTNPTGSALVTDYFEAPTDWAENYGTRMRGYFVAPVSGSYYFYIASDDSSTLLLGTNVDPATTRRIAYIDGWSNAREWTKVTSQKSAAITLAAGQQYYIEALQKEGGGGDHLAVGVEYPGGYLERPIPYHRLYPFDTQKPMVTLAVTDAAAAETGDTGAVVVTRSSAGINLPVTVTLAYGGTATRGADYAAMPTQVVFAAGVSNVTLTLQPLDDAVTEGAESAVISIVSNGAAYVLGAATTAEVTIADDDIPTVSVTAPAPCAYEQGSTSAAFVVRRDGVTGSAATVTYTLGGGATRGSDYASPPGYGSASGTVTILAGQTEAQVVITPVDDASAEGPETVQLQLVAAPLYAVGSPSSAQLTILDNDGPQPVPPPWQTVSYGSPTNSSATLTYTPSGTTFTVAGGGQIAGVTTDRFYFVQAPVYGDGEILARVASLSTTGRAGVMVREAPTNNSRFAFMGINRLVSGGTRYRWNAVTRTNAGAASVSTVGNTQTNLTPTNWVRIVRLGNNLSLYTGVGPTNWQLNQTLALTGFAAQVQMGVAVECFGGAGVNTGVVESVTLLRPEVTVATAVTAAAENPTVTGSVTFVRSWSNQTTMTVNLGLGGTASNGVDYAALPTSAAFAAGQTSVTVSVAPIVDGILEGDETVRLAVAPGPYVIGPTSSAEVVIADGTRPSISIAASPAETLEGSASPAQFTLSRTGGDTSAAVSVKLSLGGSASSGADYAALPTNVTLGAGVVSTALAVWASSDYLEEGDETVAAVVLADASYLVAGSGQATATIRDLAWPVVTVQPGEDAFERTGAAGRFLLSRRWDTTSTATVSLAIGGTASNGGDYAAVALTYVFAAGQTGGVVSIAPLADGLPEGPESVTLAIGAASNYLVGAPSSAAITVRDTAAVWDGGDALVSTWSAATNWLGNVTPLDGEGLLFDTPTRPDCTNNALSSAAWILFRNGDFALSGQPLALAGGITNEAGMNILALDLDLTAPQTFAQFGDMLAFTGAISNRGHTLSLTNTTDLYLGGPIRGTGGLTKVGPGRLLMSGVKDYTGPTYIGPSAGTALEISTGNLELRGSDLTLDGTMDLYDYDFVVGALNGSGQLTGNMDLPDNNYTVTLTLGTNGHDGFFSGSLLDHVWSVNGKLAVIKAGEGVQTLGGSNAFTGGLEIRGGSVRAVGDYAGNRVAAGCTVTVQNAATFEYASVHALPSPAGPFVVNPGGTLWFSTNDHARMGAILLNGGTILGTGSNKYDGEDFEADGNFTVRGTNASVITVANGIGLNGVCLFDIADVTGSTAPDLIVNGELENRDPAGHGFAKAGTGTMLLAANCTHSGPTLVSNGTLVVNGTNAASPVTVAGGTVLAGAGRLASVTLMPSAVVSPGTGGCARLTASSVTWFGGAAFVWNIQSATGSANDRLVCTGALALAGAPSNPCVMRVVSLDDAGQSGPISNFVGLATYTQIVASASSISGFAADRFAVDASGFANPAPGYWSVAAVGGTNLALIYSPILVSVVATDSNAAETGNNPGVFTVSRAGPTNDPVVVTFTVSGAAAAGLDYTNLGTSVTIPAGSSNAVVMVRPIDDPWLEPPEDVVLTLTATSGVYALGASVSATVWIASDDLPVVQLVATVADTIEASPSPAQFTLSRAGGDTSVAVSVNLALGGSASPGADYAALPTNVTLGAGVVVTTLAVQAASDVLEEGDEAVVLTLLPDAAYLVAGSGMATATIHDLAWPVVTVHSGEDAFERTGAAGRFLLSRRWDTTSAVTVSLAIGGTASNGVDYAAVPLTYVFAPGQTGGVVSIAPLADSLPEGPESVTLTIGAASNYLVGAPASAAILVRDAAAVWDGGDKLVSYWSAATNWLGDLTPLEGDGLLFEAPTRADCTNNALSSAAWILFRGGDFTLSGQPLALAGGITNEAGMNILALDVALTAPQTFAQFGDMLALTGIISNRGHTLTLTNLTDLYVGGTIRGTGGLVKVGSGRLLIGGIQDYTGPTYVGPSAGTALELSGGNLDLRGSDLTLDGTADLYAYDLVVGGLNGSGQLMGNMEFSNNNYTVTLTVGANGHDSQFDGSLVDHSWANNGRLAVIKTGAGTMLLAANCTHSGPTLVSNGTLVVNGTNAASPVTVAGGAVLAGAGHLASVTLLPSAVVSPGTGGCARLTAASVTWSGGAAFVWNIQSATGSANDRLVCTGALALAGAPSNPCVMRVVSLDGAGQSGPVPDFSGLDPYTQLVASAASISGFAADRFTVDASGFANPAPGVWSVAVVEGTNLALIYSPPLVSVVATESNAAETGNNPGVFTVTRTGPTSDPLVVSFAVSGAAAAGVDYTNLGASVTIPAGSSNALVTVWPIDDAEIEPPEDVVLTLTATSGVYALGVSTSAVVWIEGNTRPVVRVLAVDGTAAETGDHGLLAIERAGPTGDMLTVFFSVDGTADAADFVSFGTSVVLTAGQSSAPLELAPVADTISEGAEVVRVVLSPDAAYTVGTPGTAAVTIADIPIDDWRYAYFGADANRAGAGDLDDPDHDGNPNLLEYAQGGNPTVPDTLPAAKLAMSNNAPVFIYQRATNAQGITCWIIEAALPYDPWTNTVPIATVTNPAGARIELRNLLAPAASPERFMGLKVTRP